jgi:hypothetical protein
MFDSYSRRSGITRYRRKPLTTSIVQRLSLDDIDQRVLAKAELAQVSALFQPKGRVGGPGRTQSRSLCEAQSSFGVAPCEADDRMDGLGLRSAGGTGAVIVWRTSACRGKFRDWMVDRSKIGKA